MAEESSLHIDTDWKKQAQEEKKRLAEKAQQEQKAKAAAPPADPLAGAPAEVRASAPAGVAGSKRGARGQRDIPPASIGTLAQSLLTQTLYYLGDVAYQGGDPVANLDMAKHNIDTLGVLEEKTANNLDDDERHTLDFALHEARSRFVSVASQFI
jgi:hypothetical protein